MTRYVTQAVLVALAPLLLIARPAHADSQRIVAIEVAENSKTSDETVLLIADVEPGDDFSFELIDRVRADLVTSGLFKDVEVFSTPVQGGVKLTIVAKDKFSSIIAPTVYLQPGNQGGGIGYGENNLFGENKKLLLYGQIATADSMFILGYLDPAIHGTPFYYRADIFLRRQHVTEYSSPPDYFDEPTPVRITTTDYLNGGLMLGINLWRGVAIDGRIRAAYVAEEDPHWAEGVGAPNPAPFPDIDGWDVSAEGRIIRDKRANWYGITSGTLLQLAYEKGLPGWGSAWDYWLTNLRGQWARRIGDEQNLVIKGGFEIGHHLPFQQELTSGGVNLRGYRNAEFRGDTKGAGSLEYSIPFFKAGPLAFRGLGFFDSAYTSFTQDKGNTTRNYLPDQTEDYPNRWRNGVGLGFRIYVRSVVMPLLGIDVGYGLEVNDINVYFAVGLTEL